MYIPILIIFVSRYKENAEFEANRAGQQDGKTSPVEKPDKLAVKQQIQRLNEISKLVI